MSIDNNPAFSDGSEKIRFGKSCCVVKVEELEGLEEEGIDADFGRGFEL